MPHPLSPTGDGWGPSCHSQPAPRTRGSRNRRTQADVARELASVALAFSQAPNEPKLRKLTGLFAELTERRRRHDWGEADW